MEKYIEGRKIVFESMGDKGNIPVVMVPEMGRSVGDFELLSIKLAEAGYWTLLINPRGVNGSTGLDINIEVKDISSDIYMFLKKYGVKKAHFIGHGFGSIPIRLMAELYPELVLSTTCITMYGILPLPTEYYQVASNMVEKKISQKIELEQDITRLYFANKSDSTIWLDNWYSDAIRAYMLATARIPREEYMNGGSAPMLVVQGEQDVFTPLMAGKIIKDKLKSQVRLINIPDAAHEILHEQPIELSKAIITFLGDVNKSNFYVNSHQVKSENIKLTKGEKMNTIGSGKFIIEPKETRSFKKYADFFIPYIKDGMKILDCGSGTGSMTIEMAESNKNGDVTGIDNNHEQIKIAIDKMQQKKLNNVEFREADVYKLPFNDNTFDAVWMNMLLMHLEDPLAAVKEAARVLKAGGVFAVSDTDWDGNIMAPNYQIISQRMRINEKLLKENGSNMRHGKYNSGLLHKAGLENVLASVRVDSWGNKEAVREFADMAEAIDNVFFSGDASKMAKSMRKESWDKWASYSGTFTARTHCRAIGWKKDNV